MNIQSFDFTGMQRIDFTDGAIALYASAFKSTVNGTVFRDVVLRLELCRRE